MYIYILRQWQYLYNKDLLAPPPPLPSYRSVHACVNWLTSNSLKQIILTPAFSPAAFSSSVTGAPILTTFFNLGQLLHCSKRLLILLSSQTTVVIWATFQIGIKYNKHLIFNSIVHIARLRKLGKLSSSSPGL